MQLLKQESESKSRNYRIREREYISYSQCGLPYYIGGVNPERGRLIARVPEDFEKQNISVLTRHESQRSMLKKKSNGLSPTNRGKI